MVAILLHGIYLLTLTLAALIGCSIYKKIRREFKPLVLFLFAEMFFELYMFFLGDSIPALKNWVLPLQALVGTALLCWQAIRWNLFGKRRAILFGCIALSCMLGLAGKLLNEGALGHWFSISADLVKVIIGIEAVHRALLAESGSSFQKPMLLTGIGLLLFYTFSMLLDTFIQLGNINNQDFLEKVYILYIPFGIIANILFMRAVVLVPQQRVESLG